jgi:hypothetical protein
MIDHLLRFDDKDAAIAALPGLGMVWGEAWQWDRSYIGEVTAYIPGTYGEPDPETGELPVLMPEQVLPGYRLWIALPALDADMPGLELATDADLAAAGSPFIVFTTLSEEQLTAARLRPVRAGTAYPFGAPIAPP